MSEPFVLPETAAVLELLAAQPGPHLAEMPAGDARAVFGVLGEMFDAPADGSVRTVDFDGPACPLRAYFPAEPQAGPVIVYAHGGGWVIGNLETHHALCSLIACTTGLRVVAIDYRLAPEHPWPAAHEDCLAAAKFIASGPAELEAPVNGIAVAGDSAGGNLAYHIAASLGREQVLAQLLIYPVGDCTSPDKGSYAEFAEGFLLDRQLMDRFIGDYMPNDADRAGREASPLLHALPANLPPAVILTAGLDPLRDQGRMLASRFTELGIETHFMEAAGLIHGLATMRKGLPSGDVAIQRALAIFADVLQAQAA